MKKQKILDERCKKWALRTILELKNILSYLKINHASLTLDDIEYKINNIKFVQVYSNIIEKRGGKK